MTDFRASQDTIEVWVQNVPAVWVTQGMAEAWVQRMPTTAVVVSQALAEVWVPSLTAVLGRRRATMAQVV